MEEYTEYSWKKIYMTLILLMGLLLVAAACATTVLADDSSLPPGPPPPPPSPQVLAKGDYLYVLDMRSIYQYYLSDLSLKQTVALPDLPAPPTQVVTDGRPPMPPRCALLIEESELFVLEMRSLYKYKLPSLEMVTSTTLPIPEPPQ